MTGVPGRVVSPHLCVESMVAVDDSAEPSLNVEAGEWSEEPMNVRLAWCGTGTSQIIPTSSMSQSSSMSWLQSRYATVKKLAHVRNLVMEHPHSWLCSLRVTGPFYSLERRLHSASCASLLQQHLIALTLAQNRTRSGSLRGDILLSHPGRLQKGLA